MKEYSLSPASANGLPPTPRRNECAVKRQNDFPPPPVARKDKKVFENFGIRREDDFFWLKEKNNPEVIDYLECENRYADIVMQATTSLQEKVFGEIKGRIKEEDQSVPVFDNDYYYYVRTEEGRQYPVYCRKKDLQAAEEEILFDINKMAANKPAYIFDDFSISPDNRRALYAFNENGSFAEFILRIRDLSTGADLSEEISGTAGMCWGFDGDGIYYVKVDESLRPAKVFFRNPESRTGDIPVYAEKDPRFGVRVYKSKDRKYVFISSESTTTSELRYASAGNPTSFRLLIRRKQGVTYDVDIHGSDAFVYYKDRNRINGMVYKTEISALTDFDKWKVFIAHDGERKIEKYEVYKDYYIYESVFKGLKDIKIIRLSDNNIKEIRFPEQVYAAGFESAPVYETRKIRYVYSSLNRPRTVYEFDMETGNTVKLKEQEIPSGFDPGNYIVERLWADADDGTKVPMAVVYRKDLKKNGGNPALLYSYGSYGIPCPARFTSDFYSLIDRGFVFALAQIRGGSDMGEQWYENGKLLYKKNSFSDFIACAEKLIACHYTSPSGLGIMGGSAGGLLIGAVINRRPELFRAAVAQVPFVDVLNTMSDESLPLTTQEYEEWGNPNEETYYRYILSYSPYDNVKAQDYPDILVTAGINDSQVGYHEPAKWTAKLRTLKTGDSVLLLKTNMDSGHGGASGRFDSIRETAFELAFILNRMGITE